jgi:hypothetical protein
LLCLHNVCRFVYVSLHGCFAANLLTLRTKINQDCQQELHTHRVHAT